MRYRTWAGSPNGTPEDPTRCIASVADGGRSVLFHQCRRLRRCGPNGWLCMQHEKMYNDGDNLVRVMVERKQREVDALRETGGGHGRA